MSEITAVDKVNILEKFRDFPPAIKKAFCAGKAFGDVESQIERDEADKSEHKKN